MEPIALIVSALTAGAIAGLKDTTEQAVKDAYDRLKNLVLQKFGDKPALKVALEEHERNPDVWEKPVEQALKETDASQDEDIIRAAQRVMTLINPQQAATGKYNVQISGDVQGFVQGDDANVTMNFGEHKKK